MIRDLAALRLRHFCLLAGLGLAILGLALWSDLPAVNQDEYLSLFPITWFKKEPEARSAALYGYSENLFGHAVPMRSYPYVGALKAYIYAATFLPTTIDVYRAAKVVLLWALFSVILLGCWRVSRGSALACAVCLGWLLSDIALVVLGATDPGQQILSLTLGACLFVLLLFLMESPRWWYIVPIAVVVFLGEWDRVNFLWFVASGIAACTAASLAGPWRNSLRGMAVAITGCATGLAGTAFLIPDYPKMALAGAETSIGTFDWLGLWQHWQVLYPRLDPFGAYHIFLNTAAPVYNEIYATYRWTWSLLYVVIVAAGLFLGLARLRKNSQLARPLLFHSAFMGSLLYVILKTSESWASHHVLVLKPFAYLGLGVLTAALISSPRMKYWLSTAMILLWVGHTSISILGFREMTAAPSKFGVYDVSWNQADAWQAAARTPVKAVYALDWGVFYPGVLNSPADQRWEMPGVNELGDLRKLDAARKGFDMALLFHTNGPRSWILNAPNAKKHYGIVDIQHFNRHSGEPWTLAVLSVDRWSTPAGMATGIPDLVHNGDFADGTSVWRHEKFETQPQSVDVTIRECEIEGIEHACGLIDHRAPADSRIVQPILLVPGVVYEISAWARADEVDQVGKGVHLVLLDHYEAESEELHGTSGWRQLRFYIVNLGVESTSVQLAARLGTWGSLMKGRAWFTAISARTVEKPEVGFQLYEIGGAE